jgi:hypothetical protein
LGKGDGSSDSTIISCLRDAVEKNRGAVEKKGGGAEEEQGELGEGQATHRKRGNRKKGKTHASSLFPCSCSIPTNGIPNSIS